MRFFASVGQKKKITQINVIKFAGHMLKCQLNEQFKFELCPNERIKSRFQGFKLGNLSKHDLGNKNITKM